MTKLVIRDGIKQIDPYQYTGRGDIDELDIADSVEEIGEGAFSECPNLKKITWGSGIHIIGGKAFYKCESLKLLQLPNSIRRVGSRSFESCPSLVYVEFEDGDSVEIEDEVFTDCTGLVCAILPRGLNNIHRGTFFGCSNLEDIFIPGTVTSIGPLAFCGVAAEQIDLPDSIECIDMFAFFGSKLTSVVIPDRVLTIGESAFGRCSGLRCADIGNSVVCVGKKAFDSCSMLDEVTFRSEIIGSIGNYIFKKCKSLKRINVPASVMDTYKRMLLPYLHRKLVGF